MLIYVKKMFLQKKCRKMFFVYVFFLTLPVVGFREFRRYC